MKRIYEILHEVANAPTKEDKRNILWFNQSTALKAVLQSTFHPNIQWVFNRDNITFKPDLAPPGMGYATIATSLTKLYLYRKDNPELSPNLTIERRRELLIQLLESMEQGEANTLLNMMSKDLQIKGLTYNLVKEVFPDILP